MWNIGRKIKHYSSRRVVIRTMLRSFMNLAFPIVGENTNPNLDLASITVILNGGDATTR